MDRWLVLSPHLDDAVLSCGGLIASLAPSSTVRVATVFTAAPFWGPYSGSARWLHGVCGHANASLLAIARKREDRAALKLLKAHWTHLSFRDAVYRRSITGEWLYDGSVQCVPKSADAALILRLVAVFQKLAAGQDLVLCPLGIGGHVDHRIVRMAAVAAGVPLAFYRDVPYCWLNGAENENEPADFDSVIFELAPAKIEMWQKAVELYSTQVPMLDNAVGSLVVRLKEYAGQPQKLFAGAPKADLVCRKIHRKLCNDF